MSLLKNIQVGNDIAEEKDVIGGGSRILDSGIYRATVTLAYLQKSSGGAMGLVLHLKTSDDKELRQTVYITSGDAKGNLPYYVDAKGQKQYLPGFNLGNSLALLTTGKMITELDTDDKVVKLYDFDAKAEVLKTVAVVTDLLGQEVYAAVIKQTVDKNVKDASGAYVASGDTREENEIDKFFCAKDGYDKMTSAEIRAKKTNPDQAATFFDQWLGKWAGQVKDKSTKGAGTAGAPGAAKPAAAAGGGNKPTASLFG